ncbi:MAG: Uma2 family endonuclease [Acidobacteriaceae bacterium]
MSAVPVVWEDESQTVEGAAPGTILLPLAMFPVSLRPARRLSDEEFLRFSAANEFLRIEQTAEGELIVMIPVGSRTSNKEGYIGRELDLWVEKEQRGIAFNSNIAVSFSDGNIRMPDAAWLSSERWNALTEKQKDGFLPICPEFIVELRSRTDRVSSIEAKMEFWMSHGAQLAWLIDPQRKLAMIYRPGQEPETLLQPEILHGEGPIAGFSLKMQRLWE